MSQARFEAAKGRSPAETLALLDNAWTWPETYEVVLGAKQHTGDAAFMGQLVERLADTRVTEVGLTHKLVLWERIATGQVLSTRRTCAAATPWRTATWSRSPT